MQYHLEGVGGYPRNPERALAYAMAAAEGPHTRGSAWAQWTVGMMILRGAGTAPNAERAYEWVARAADNGSVNGMISRAVMLALGQGVRENDAEARLWYARAGESGEPGSAHALRGLAGMLLTGEGGPADPPRGYAYLMIAAEGGDPVALQMLSVVPQQISAGDRAHAQTIADEWRALHPRPHSEVQGGPFH